MREPNPDPPAITRLGSGEVVIYRGALSRIEDGEFVKVIGNKRMARWDERPYEVIRVCDCGHEWGHVP